jgi:replicative DNA helicase
MAKKEKPKEPQWNPASLGIQMPYNMQAEQSVLGAALIDDTILTQLITQLEPEMFYSEQNRAVFDQMSRLFADSEAVDLVTLVDALASSETFKGADDVKIYLTRLAETVPAISNVESYIRIVQDKYKARRVIEAAGNIIEKSRREDDADLLLENAEQQIYDIRNGRTQSGVKTLQDSILEVIDTLQKLSGPDHDKYSGIPTGFTYLDTTLTGLGRSDLIILAARPGMGKTSFALNIATNVARMQKVPTVVFSLEMTCEQLTDRILSSTAGIDSQTFRTGNLNDSDWSDLAGASSLLYHAPIYMDDSSGITVAEMKAKIRQIDQDPKKEPIGLVIIDYLQLMQSAKHIDNRVQEISDITRNLKIMAKELNVPVIALSQLSRAAEKTSGRSDHRPQLSDLRDSGSIEQDADIVLFLYRAAYYNSQSEEGQQADENTAECIVAKNRHGETTTIQLGWDGAHTRFMNLDYSHGNVNGN